MKLAMMSVFVDDQTKALAFYTDVLGFVKQQDFPAGEFRWITVVSPEGPDDMQLVLEPNDNPISKAYQQGLYEQGIPIATFRVDNVQKEHERLVRHGVTFRADPAELMPGLWMATFEDTCGNLISIFQPA